MSVFPLDTVKDELSGHLPAMGRQQLSIYWILLGFPVICGASLFFIRVYISVHCGGIIRPSMERIELRSAVSGTIDQVYFKDGDSVGSRQLVLRLRDGISAPRNEKISSDISDCRHWIRDLGWLTAEGREDADLAAGLVTDLYKGQAERYLNRKQEQMVSLRKAAKEVEMNRTLASDRVISPKEFYDLQWQLEKISLAYKAFCQEQRTAWQQELIKYRSALDQFQLQERELKNSAETYEIRTPLAGIVQGISTSYPGSHVQANDVICSVSPEGPVIGECYVSSRDIGFIRRGQAVRFRIDAFDYNYFGVTTGKVLSIDNDFSLVGNNPVFRIHCGFDSCQLHLRTGFTGYLKKGLTFQARFIVGSRTAWQLLFEKLGDWIP
jgi:membrane fusion protein, peptide pheromone/bacteriocin exporter